jgi:O-antigen/teichoic acid export membrane protein
LNVSDAPENAPEAQNSQPHAHLHQQARRGIRLLLGRQVAVQALTFAGGVVLARALHPAQFGLYAIATFLVQILAQFGDFGLAPSLIQRKSELTERDLQVAFTLQQTLIAGVVLLLMLLAPWLAHWYPQAPSETVWLVRALAFTLFLTSWRTMSALQLERRLRYDRLARVEIVEALSYQGVAVALALSGAGVWSLVWATLARGVLGTLLIYLAAPWRIRLGFDRQTAGALLRFGVPYQLQALAGNLGSTLTPTLVAGVCGAQAVGYLGWASANGNKPLVLVDNIVRISFPHFSRLQDDPREVERILGRYLNALLSASGLWFVTLLAAGRPLVSWIYTDKWQPALPALLLYSGAVSFHVIVWMMGTALNGLGRVQDATRIVLIRTLCQFALGIPLVLWLGFNGVAVAVVVIEAVSVPITASILGPRVLRGVVVPLGWVLVPMTLGAAAGLLFGQIPLPMPTGARALGAALSVAGAYLGGAWFAAPDWMRRALVARLSSSGAGAGRRAWRWA